MLIKIPIRLVSESNSSQHWTKKKKRHDTHKMLVKCFLESRCDVKPPCEIILTRYAPRSLDSDNLQGAFKWIRDTIAQWFLGGRPGRKDSDPCFTWIYNQKKTKEKEYYITIEIYPRDKQDSISPTETQSVAADLAPSCSSC